MKTHKDLNVYKESLNLVIDIYNVTDKFPTSEKFGLTGEMRRASISIPSNISEGATRNSTKEFIRFLYISLSSLREVETQLEIAFRLQYLNKTEIIQNKIVYIRRMLLNLIKSISK